MKTKPKPNTARTRFDALVLASRAAVDKVYATYGEGRVIRGEAMQGLKELRDHVQAFIGSVADDMVANDEEDE